MEQPSLKEKPVHGFIIRVLLIVVGLAGLALMIVISAKLGSTDEDCTDSPLRA